jgi:uncharacterized protein YjbI with pentapeptide repeats
MDRYAHQANSVSIYQPIVISIDSSFSGKNTRIPILPLVGAWLSQAKLKETNLQEANLEGAKLQRANLDQADLQQANLDWADFQGAHFWEANLQRATLLA